MKTNITSIVNNKEAAEALIEKISKVAPKGIEYLFIGNVIVKIKISGYIIVEELEGLKKLGLEFEAIEASGRDEISLTFKRGTA